MNSNSKECAPEFRERSEKVAAKRSAFCSNIRKQQKKSGKNAPDPWPDQPDFTKIDIRVGQINKVWLHPEADKLYCEEIDVGEDAPREIASGLREHYTLEQMEGRKVGCMQSHSHSS